MPTLAEILQGLYSRTNPRGVMAGPSNAKAQGLLVPGTIPNLYNRPVTNNPGIDPQAPAGTRSTTLSASFNIGGKEVLLPTVVNGKFLTNKEAIARYLKTGEH